MNMTYEEIIEALETAIKIGDAPIGKNFACTISKLTAREALNLLKWQNAEINHYKINLPYLEHQNEDFCGVPCKFMEDLIKKKVDELDEKMQAEIKRLNTALSLALKFNSDLEADKRLANVELDRLNSEVARLESDCKTLSAVLSKWVEFDKEAVSAFIGFLEEHAKIEVFKRPKINLDYEAKFLYIDDIKRLEKEFWEGEEE